MSSDFCGWVRHVIDSCRVKAKVHQARAGLDMLKVGFSALPPSPPPPPSFLFLGGRGVGGWGGICFSLNPGLRTVKDCHSQKPESGDFDTENDYRKPSVIM
jgi:hypothetical protein